MNTSGEKKDTGEEKTDYMYILNSKVLDGDAK